MEISLLGLPKSGKTTVFNALTGSSAVTSAFASGKAEPNIAVVKVPDFRIDELSKMYQPKKTTYATVKYVDVAGIGGEGGAEVRGVPEALLQHVCKSDALIAVIRGFADDISGNPSVASDAESIHMEMIFSDLTKVENRIIKIDKGILKSTGREKDQMIIEKSALEKIKPALEENIPVRSVEMSEDEEKSIRGFQFLTAKPTMYVINTDENGMSKSAELIQTVKASLGQYKNTMFECMAGAIEMEIAQLEGDDRTVFLNEYGIEKPAADRVIKMSYDLLGYISFLTSGSDEVRAWTIVNGSTAPQAAGAIHSDFERGFIRAEVIGFQDLIGAGGFSNAKKLGKVRLEGKTYIMNDGDVVNFLFSV